MRGRNMKSTAKRDSIFLHCYQFLFLRSKKFNISEIIKNVLTSGLNLQICVVNRHFLYKPLQHIVLNNKIKAYFLIIEVMKKNAKMKQHTTLSLFYNRTDFDVYHKSEK